MVTSNGESGRGAGHWRVATVDGTSKREDGGDRDWIWRRGDVVGGTGRWRVAMVIGCAGAGPLRDGVTGGAGRWRRGGAQDGTWQAGGAVTGS
uniref:Uncharacterized protein n=1 Tax=Oryza meridionalis TaxID=40149 RepID=A0A0E0ELG4_9ORYZ